MIRRILCSTLAVIAGAAVVAHADPKDDVTGAITKLSAAPNYTYTLTRTFGQNQIVTTVKTEKDGYTFTSTDMGGNTMESYAKGTVSVMKSPDGTWMTPAEMAAAGGGGGGGRRGGRGGVQGPAPAVQLAGWVDKLQNVAKGDDAYTADLDSDTSTALAQASGRGGRRGGGGGGTPPVIKDAKAGLKFWIADGNLTKYETHVTGTRTVNDQDMPIDSTVTTEIKDVGATRVDVPADAKTKLDAPPAPPAQ
jgi:hypothetical protein